MIVYVEYVFIDNFVIDMLIFKLSFALANIYCARGRLVLCSFLGAVFALLYPLITADRVIIAAVKILFGLILTLFTGKFRGAKQYLNFTLTFFAVTFLFGGAVYGLYSVLGIDTSSEFSVGFTILPVAAIYYAAKRVVVYILRKKTVKDFYADAEIIFAGDAIKVRGFFDTGNGLFDGASPVIVANKAAILPKISGGALKTAKSIGVNTLSGKSRKISLKPSAVVIYYKDKRNIFYNVSVCLTDEKFDGYDVILHPSLMQAAGGESKDANKIRRCNNERSA